MDTLPPEFQKRKKPAKFKIVSFDMDGTLTRKVTALQYYLQKLNQEKKAAELENLYRTHKIDDDQVADAYAKILKGASLKQLENWTKEIPQMKNIKNTVQKIKDLGLVVGITSVGPIFASETFKKLYGFDFITGSKHKFINNIHAGKMINTLSGKDKLKVLKSICEKYKTSLKKVIAVGDSRSDIPIFESVGVSIALNADENLTGKTDQSLETDDLLEVYNLIKKIYGTTSS